MCVWWIFNKVEKQFFCVRTASTVSFSWPGQWNWGRPPSDPDSPSGPPSFTKAPLSLWASSLWRLYRVWLPKTRSVKREPWTVRALTKHMVTQCFISIEHTLKNRCDVTEKCPHWTGQITPELAPIGRCKALYNFTTEQDDELNLEEGRWSWSKAVEENVESTQLCQWFRFTGDLLDIYVKGDNGWWFGELNGKTGHFPSTYVEESPVRSPDAWRTHQHHTYETQSGSNCLRSEV